LPRVTLWLLHVSIQEFLFFNSYF